MLQAVTSITVVSELERAATAFSRAVFSISRELIRAKKGRRYGTVQPGFSQSNNDRFVQSDVMKQRLGFGQ